MSSMTEEAMLDHLEFKGFEISDSLDLMAKAEALGYRWDENSELWAK
ncbi:hypothetical protein [Paenibacillus abyssi]|uniref:Uncharacterized protein n=1 Tax=Paenibacillus abyssi TaxID=1340531 RepID=A0A917LF63_9BACL|nr:hypothetical protein [Paenibacillus abyssi]GGG18391.1 hypothetical protein GCM10010916_39030 [Paenibacillus abyssi]